MADSPQSPSGPPQRPGNSGQPRKDRSGNSGFWYLLAFGILTAVIYMALSAGSQREQINLSAFFSGVDSGQFNKDNVYDLSLGPTELTWQNKSREDVKAGVTDAKYFRVYVWGIEDSQRKALTDLLDKEEIPWSGGRVPSEWTAMLPMLFLLGIVVVLFIVALRRLGGPGSAMSFGRSRGRLYAQEDIKVTFKDVAGIEEAVEELKEVVEFLKTPQKYQALGGRIPRGVLLVGPPGTGKTMLAKAVAGEAGVPFFGLSGSDFVEMFVGVGAARVRDMFQQALQKSPAIIFIDELDALGKTRGSGMPGGHDEREQTLNALLVEMDGFGTDQSVIVMGATNRPETLDPALMRPGRFDRHVLVDRPDIHGREAILDVHARRVKLSDDVDIKKLARMTPGFVGADLANLCNEAALLSARRDEKRVTMQSFEDGIERVMAGLEKSSRIILEEIKQRVACHESGHALVAASLPNTDPVHKISIIPRGMGALGYMLQLPENDRELVTQSELESRIAVLLGGIAAEQIVYNETSTGAQNDLQRATDFARRMVTEFGMSPRLGRMFYSEKSRSPFLGAEGGGGDSVHSEQTLREIDLEVKRIVDESYRTATEILTTQRAVLTALTDDLIEKETMTAEEMHQIIDAHRDAPRLMPGTSASLDPQPEDSSRPEETSATGDDQSA